MGTGQRAPGEKAARTGDDTVDHRRPPTARIAPELRERRGGACGRKLVRGVGAGAPVPWRGDTGAQAVPAPGGRRPAQSQAPADRHRLPGRRPNRRAHPGALHAGTGARVGDADAGAPVGAGPPPPSRGRRPRRPRRRALAPLPGRAGPAGQRRLGRQPEHSLGVVHPCRSVDQAEHPAAGHALVGDRLRAHARAGPPHRAGTRAGVLAAARRIPPHRTCQGLPGGFRSGPPDRPWPRSGRRSGRRSRRGGGGRRAGRTSTSPRTALCTTWTTTSTVAPTCRGPAAPVRRAGRCRLRASRPPDARRAGRRRGPPAAPPRVRVPVAARRPATRPPAGSQDSRTRAARA